MICCVEDDAGIRNMMLYTLNASRFEAEGFEDGKAFFAALGNMTSQNRPPQFVILDIMLPGDDGIEILNRFRKTPTTTGIPVIMATAKGIE